MQIIWFSEIKWSYLRTRKQQILSRFPKYDKIYFIEPISTLKRNNYTIKQYSSIFAITIPQIRSTEIKIIKFLLNLVIVRKVLSIVADFLLKFFINKQKIHPDIIITSNVYWINSINTILTRNNNIKLIYDCNDDPLGFPNTPAFKKQYLNKTTEIVDHIIIPHKSYQKIIPQQDQCKIKIIPNGVDFKLFQRPVKMPSELKMIKSPIVLCTGAIDSRLDYNLLLKLIKILNTYHFVFIGPISKHAMPMFKEILYQEKVTHIQPTIYSNLVNYIKYSKVCIIPFVKNRLTSSILPNKLFEYTAAGKTCVATNFSESLHEFSSYLDIANTHEDFIAKVKKAVQSPFEIKKLTRFASQYDWNKISKQYYCFLDSIIH